MSFQWQVTPGQAFDEMYRAYTRTLFTTGARVMQARADEMTAWARSNAPWTDRTGEARRTLHTIVEHNPQVLGTIILRHGADHGLWLEIAYGGRWAIIAPAIDHWGPIIMKDIQKMMNLGIIAGD